MIYLLNCIQYELLNLFSANSEQIRNIIPISTLGISLYNARDICCVQKNKSPTEYPLLSASVYLPGFHIIYLKSDYFSILFCAIKGDERISVLIGHNELQ